MASSRRCHAISMQVPDIWLAICKVALAALLTSHNLPLQWGQNKVQSLARELSRMSAGHGSEAQLPGTTVRQWLVPNMWCPTQGM